MESQNSVRRHITAVSVQKKNEEVKTEGSSSTGRENMKRENFLQADSDQIDLDALLQAVLEISEKNSEVKSYRENGNGNERLSRRKANHLSRSFGSSGDEAEGRTTVSQRRSSNFSRDSVRRNKQELGINRRQGYLNQDPRRNLSFTNEKVFDIDRENDRLLREITKGHSRKKKDVRVPLTKQPVKVMSSAQINRLKQQQKIERENMALLGRLQKVKPSKDLSRQHLLESKNGPRLKATVNNGVPTIQRRPGSSTSSMYSSGFSTRASSVVDVRDLDNSILADDQSSRPATRNHDSGSKLSRLKQSTYAKPVWEAGW